MQITLTQELEDLINEEMQTGKYFSPAEVLREGLLSLRIERVSKEARREHIRREVMKGVEQIRNGESRVYNSPEELAEDIKREARLEFEAKKKNAK